MLAAESPSRSRVTWLDLVAVFILTAAVFAPVLRSGFSPLDDPLMIYDNSKVTEFSWKHFKSFWTDPTFHIYMPLALATWQFVALVTHHGTSGGSDYFLPEYGFKIVSVLTHAAAAAATVWVLSILTRTRWPAIVGGLLFALHPMQVESVAWTTGLKDEYCGLFSILCIGFYARHAERQDANPAEDLNWWLAMLAAVLATLSKPTSMVLPAMLLAVDWALRRCPPARRFVSLALFLIPSILIAIVILAVQGKSPVDRLSLPLRPLVAMDTYAFYMGKLLWPVKLSVDYGRRPLVILHSGAIYWTWIFPAAALVAVLLMRSRRWVLAAALFVVPIIPVSGITAFDMQQYSTVTDHYVYQSLAGVGLIAALLIVRWPKLFGTVCVAALLVSSALTYRTATRWTSMQGLYRQMLVDYPHSWLARDQLGSMAYVRGDLFGMKQAFEQSLSDNPKDSIALEIESSYYLALGRYRESAAAAEKAIEHFTMRRVQNGRRIALIGAQLHDINLAERGLKYWQAGEPDNEYVARMLQSVRQAKREQERVAATSKPATQTSK